ncbi:MAG: recombinase family protein [Chloroflexi bacterium]|nr:recombinase family protein [Chloroflexota bacterium]MCI0826122.1 recombinase family protein [Chloroflexota bacterium]MCI0859015.1 recombinase family protein [Chloroflexota bacterium]
MNRAAIWCRVSTQDQREMSLDSQEAAVRPVLESEGFTVPPDRILKVDWSSLDLSACPEFQQLRQWVVDGSIDAIGLLDRDRLQAQGLQRLIFLSDCQERGVRLVTCQGPPMFDGGEGQLVELALALGKEKSVQRAQQGSKDGLRDRARLRGLPVTGIPPYGFRFRYLEAAGKRVPVALEPDPATYHIAVRIWRMALDGIPMRRIALELAEAGILAPKGGKSWNPSTIKDLLDNPAPAGRYAALRQEMKAPEKRRKSDTYGKTSSRRLPIEDWVFLPDFPVESPILTWTEWEAVHQQLERNQANATRNGKRSYALRGMLFCSEDGRRLCGHSRKGRDGYVYECPGRRGRVGVPRCTCPRVSGWWVENRVWEEVVAFLGDRQTFQHEIQRRRQVTTSQESEIQDKIAGLERKLGDVYHRETELVGLRLRGVVSDEALDRNAALLRAEHTHYQDEIDRQNAALDTLEQSEAAVASLEALRGRLTHYLDSTTPEDRRAVLEALDTRVTVGPGGVLDLSIGVPQHLHDAMADCVHQPQGQ